MAIIGLNEWDTTGKLSPYKRSTGEQLTSALNSMVGTFQKQQQDKQFRDAIKKEMGIDIPAGVDAGKLYEMILGEKAKAQFDPEAQMMNRVFGSQPGITPPLTTGGINPNVPTAIDGMNLNQGQLLRGMMSKKFGVPYEQMMTPEEKRVAQQQKLELSPLYQQTKDKRTSELIDLAEQNKVRKQMIANAKEASGKIPTGLGGKMKMWWSKMFDPENPVMEDWQKVKMVLTDAQLMNTAKTKGAISDREMELFSKAAANDDIASIKAMQPVFDKLVRFMDAEQSGKIKSYKAIYNENPETFLGADDPLGLR